MGCFSSKITTKSARFRNQSLTTNPGAKNPNGSKNPFTIIKYPNSNSNIEATKEPERDVIETINAWELLAGLEDKEDEEEEHQNDNDSEHENSSDHIKRDVLKGEKGSKRKAMAKELTSLKVPSMEFGKSGSLRDWLVQGGPESYITPKFGNFDAATRENINGVFHPELVAHFEEALEQMNTEEERILEGL